MLTLKKLAFLHFFTRIISIDHLITKKQTYKKKVKNNKSSPYDVTNSVEIRLVTSEAWSICDQK